MPTPGRGSDVPAEPSRKAVLSKSSCRDLWRPKNGFFTVLDDYRRLKSSQATPRGGLAANSAEWTMSHYNSDSVVSSAYTVSADGGADLAHV